jgi:serine kinase of HPr protein (carbohydrate metabolism regulator)
MIGRGHGLIADDRMRFYGVCNRWLGANCRQDGQQFLAYSQYFDRHANG